MKFKSYIQNPTGGKSSVMSYRKMYEDLYQDKWGKLMTRENGKIEYKLYKGKDEYVAYLKIPSEAIEKFYYDVVIQMKTKMPEMSLDNVEDCRFFSNDPSFNFTFAYAFVKHDMHIKELIKKMSPVAIRKKPVEKNPDVTIGYVKSLYFAYIYMKDKGLLNRVRFEAEAKPLDWKLLEKLIMNTDDKVRDREEAATRHQKQKKRDSNGEIRYPHKLRKEDIKSPEIVSRAIDNIKQVGFVGKIGSANKKVDFKVGKTKKTKKI